MGYLFLVIVAAVGVAIGASGVARASSSPTSRRRETPVPRPLPGPFMLPPPNAADWAGWVWPVAVTEGREPVITQRWKPGHDPPPGEASTSHANHLGVDIMFPKRPGDPGIVKHLATKGFIAPEGTKILASGPGKIWGTYHSDFYGNGILVDHGVAHPNLGGVTTFYQHLDSFARPWKKGDVVEPGTVLGTMGFAPGSGEAIRHLHFELRFPRVGVPDDTTRIDPAPYMKFWRKIAA